MAFVAPFLAALGGGSSAAGAVVAASTVASVASGVMASAQARSAGQAQKDQYTAEARQEADAARQREIERRRALLTSLSSQNAAAAASGVSLPTAVANRDIKYFSSDLLYDRANTSRRTSILSTAGNNAVRAGNAAAAMSLLDTAQKAYSTYGGAYGNAFDKFNTPSTTTGVRVGTSIGPR